MSFTFNNFGNVTRKIKEQWMSFVKNKQTKKTVGIHEKVKIKKDEKTDPLHRKTRRKKSKNGFDTV